MADIDLADDLEPQDRAETLDETHLTEDGEDIANFDDLPDVLDVTSEDGDDDEDDDLGDDEDDGEGDDDEDPAELGYDDERRQPDHDPHVERQLDKGLKETFPASDPVSINPGAD